MDPALKVYLDKLHAETKAWTDDIRRLLQDRETVFSKFDTVVSTPQPAHSMVAASDGGLAVDTTVAAVLSYVSSSTTKARETLEVLPDASLDSIDQTPVTCSTDGLNQVVHTDNVNKVRDAATTVCPEPAVDLNDKEVEQLLPARAPSSIGTGASSITEEVVPPVVTTTDVDPKAGVRELDALSVNTSTPVTSEADHGVILIIPSDLAAPVLTTCSTKCLVHDGDWVKPVHLVDKSKNWCMPSVLKGIEQQPWPPPLRMGIRHRGHLFRPRPWPSFKYHSDACYPEERCSGISSQPHEVSWFNPWLVLLLFRNVVFLQVSCCELIPMEEAFSFQSVEILQYIPDDPRLLMWPPTSAESVGKIVVQEIPSNGTLNTFSGDGRAVQVWSELPKGECYEDYYSSVNNFGSPMTISVDDLGSVDFKSSDLGSSDLNLMRKFCWCLQSAQQKTCPSENVICWIPMVPRPLPIPSQKLMQLMDNVNFTVAERVSVISSMRSSHEFHPQVQQASCARMFSVSTELQGYDRTKLRPRPWPLFEFNQETIQLKLQWTSFSGNCQAVHVVFEQYLCGQLYLKVMSMSVYEQFLNHEEIRGSGHFARKCSSEQCRHLWDLLAFFMVQPICCCEQSFSYSQGAHLQFWRSLEGAAYFCDRVTYIAEYGKRSSKTIHWEQQNGRTSSLLAAVELTFRPMHMRMLQGVEIFMDLISTITTENYSSGSSIVYPGNVHKRRVQYNAVENREFNSNIFLCFGIHLIGNILSQIWWEPIVTQSGECLPLLHPKPPWSPLAPTNFITEFRGNLRSNFEFLHITGVLL